MSRTTRYKWAYLAFVGLGSFASTWAARHFGLPVVAILGIAAALLVPGRVLGYFWRDLLRGLRLLKEKNYAESKRHSELFLQQLQRRPWIKRLIWLGSGTYSRDPEAMALNNLGAAEIGLGEAGAARRHLQASIAVDDQNPLPYFNMGLLLASTAPEEAAQWLRQAADRGYSRGLTDKIIAAAQSRFAFTDGQGKR